MSLATIPVDVQRAIRRDYAARDAEGHWCYSLSQVASRNGVCVDTVTRVRKAWGLRRYMTRAA